MKLIANKAGIGDFFLINDKENYIIDGGNKKVNLRILPSRIQTVICTHNDQDHTQGIIDLLKRSNSAINEVWLPGLWLPIIDFITDFKLDFKDFLTICYDYKESEPDNNILNNFNLEDALVEDSEFTDSYYNLMLERLRMIKDYEEFSQCLIWKKHFHHCFKPDKIVSKQLFNMHNILTIAHNALEKGCKIRWFFPQNNIQKEIHSPFVAVNSKEMLRIKKIREGDTQAFFNLLYLTPENKYSLVFEYVKEEKPIILFTADSNLSFLGNSNLSYQESIIITAPHHGSETNKDAYSKIIGKKIIYLRSGGSANRKPGTTFLSLINQKYCNKCIFNNLPEGRTEFSYSNNNWRNHSGYNCKC